MKQPSGYEIPERERGVTTLASCYNNEITEACKLYKEKYLSRRLGF